MKFIFRFILILLLLVHQVIYAADSFSKKEFLNLAFDIHLSEVENKTLWLEKNIQTQIAQILDHNYPKLRLKYKQYKSLDKIQTVWFLDEIGKERPISFAISITNDQIDFMKVIKFRESRGGEIQMQAFSQQFNQIALNKNNLLNKNIDGITGATMSVSAMKKIARVALVLHKFVNNESVPQ